MFKPQSRNILALEEIQTPKRLRKPSPLRYEPPQEKIIKQRDNPNFRPCQIFNSPQNNSGAYKRQQSPHRIPDHPQHSFYLVDRSEHIKQNNLIILDSCDFQRQKYADLSQIEDRNISYVDKNNIQILATPKQKKYIDTSSDIFYEPTAKYSPAKLERMEHTKKKWYQMKGSPGQVNEKVTFDKGYAKKRKQEENRTQTLPDSNVQTPHKRQFTFQEDHPNPSNQIQREMKKKSFSNLKMDRKSEQRSLSPQFHLKSEHERGKNNQKGFLHRPDTRVDKVINLKGSHQAVNSQGLYKWKSNYKK